MVPHFNQLIWRKDLKELSYKLYNDLHSKVQDKLDIATNPERVAFFERQEADYVNITEFLHRDMSSIANLCPAFRLSPELMDLGLEISRSLIG